MSGGYNGNSAVFDAYIPEQQALRVVALAGISESDWDYVAVTYPTGTQEVYTFKTGGSGGTTVVVVTINYTDSTKANILNVAKT